MLLPLLVAPCVAPVVAPCVAYASSSLFPAWASGFRTAYDRRPVDRRATIRPDLRAMPVRLSFAREFAEYGLFEDTTLRLGDAITKEVLSYSRKEKSPRDGAGAGYTAYATGVESATVTYRTTGAGRISGIEYIGKVFNEDAEPGFRMTERKLATLFGPPTLGYENPKTRVILRGWTWSDDTFFSHAMRFENEDFGYEVVALAGGKTSAGGKAAKRR